MVYMSGSKMARYSSSLAGINTSGGPKKQGLPSTIGGPASVTSIYRTSRAGFCCLAFNKRLPIGKTVSWKGTVGMRHF